MNTLTFSAGYSNFHSKLIVIAYSILKNYEEAEDVVSSVLIQAYENKHKINPNTFENLMTISVKNKCVDTMRSGRKKRIRYYPIIDENYPFVETPIDEKLIINESHKELNKAINELPPIQKKLIILKYLEGKDRKTMAIICKSNEFTVRNNLALGLKNLRKKFSK
jgi:RNA polymerase sigma factor (sigma-70 family)